MMTTRPLVLACLLAACEQTTHTHANVAVQSGTQYEVRIAESTIGANGHTRHEVFAFGVSADGTIASDSVVLGMDRQTAGTLSQRELTLGPLGATTYFTPCSQSDASCLGPAALTLALASDPSTIIATAPIELVVPTHVSTAAPCRGPGTTLYFDSSDTSIRWGMTRITQWQLPYTEVNTPSDPKEIRLSLSPARMVQGNTWSIGIDTYAQTGPLALGVYLDAQRSHFAATGHPGLNVSGDGSGCNAISGAFEIHELAISTGLDAITISFEQYCENSPSKLLEGCVRYAK